MTKHTDIRKLRQARRILSTSTELVDIVRDIDDTIESLQHEINKEQQWEIS